jgi:catechol 2,3-dioxygenase-like lactoylglutathione lyase family enzyme
MSSKLPVTKIGHVAYSVKNPEESSAFYEKILGLQITKQSSDAVVMATGGLYSDQSPIEFVLYPGAETRLHHIAFEVENKEDLQVSKGILEHHGIQVQENENEFGQPSLLFKGPYDHTIEICTGVRMPVEGANVPFRLTKLGHITLKAPDPSIGKTFFEDVMGFRLSEAIGEKFFWLRCNVDHHTVGFCTSPNVGVQHVAFEVGCWEDIMRFNDHLMKHEVKIEYGPGRHGPGNNIFIYFVDPNGIRFELFCDMLRIYNEQDYVPKVWDPDKRMHSVNQWGPTPPASFLD